MSSRHAGRLILQEMADWDPRHAQDGRSSCPRVAEGEVGNARPACAILRVQKAKDGIEPRRGLQQATSSASSSRIAHSQLLREHRDTPSAMPGVPVPTRVVYGQFGRRNGTANVDTDLDLCAVQRLDHVGHLFGCPAVTSPPSPSVSRSSLRHTAAALWYHWPSVVTIRTSSSRSLRTRPRIVNATSTSLFLAFDNTPSTTRL
ncbi:hypothetical protein PAXRUDRAFT_604360 [Paxillus rubicundulus Ve08.2h10]|uniref:Uncharacterized protein n=1 Tax=Paxillus rubicundulus Ve08.2h10 TaxID=930991 RepID=A0A0D0DL59_9AGAM|nr:hypothetical protein PAXRUDRAFT_604360 [Paxillus rubicundulus Ve08.2h10]